MPDPSQDSSTPNQPHSLRIIKIGTCSSLTGKSTLGYHIGCNDQAEICFRMASNTGGGYFSPNWIPLNAILSAMEQAPKPLTSFALMPLFAGKTTKEGIQSREQAKRGNRISPVNTETMEAIL